MDHDAQQRGRSRLGGLATAARYDSREINAKARDTYRTSFRSGHGCALCSTITIPAGLPEVEVDRRAVALRRLHFTRLALRSAQARTGKAAPAIVTPEAAQEARRARDEHPTAA